LILYALKISGRLDAAAIRFYEHHTGRLAMRRPGAIPRGSSIAKNESISPEGVFAMQHTSVQNGYFRGLGR
jgi:hypothetical protein